MWTLLNKHKAIVLCNICYMKAYKEVLGGQRGRIKGKHIISEFKDAGDAWWFKEEYAKDRERNGYTVGCLCCRKRIEPE